MSDELCVIVTENTKKRDTLKEYCVGFDGIWKVYSLEDSEEEIYNNIKNAIAIYCIFNSNSYGEKLSYIIQLKLKNKKILTPFYRVHLKSFGKQQLIESLNQEDCNINMNLVELENTKEKLFKLVEEPVSLIMSQEFVRKREKEQPTGTSLIIAPSLSILVEQEIKIAEHENEEYKKIYSDYVIDGIHIRAVLKAKFKEENEIEMNEVIKRINSAEHIVESFKENIDYEKNPPKPLITSTLLRSIYYLYSIDETLTIKLAKLLYEGIEVYGKKIGLITNIYTSSFNVDDDAYEESMKVCIKRYGDENISDIKRDYSEEKKENDDKNNEFKECIRPLYFEQKFEPLEIKDELSKYENGKELFLIYEYIYNRFISLSMANSRYDKSRMVVDADGNKLEVHANEKLYDGWEMISRTLVKSSMEGNEYEREVILPLLEEGEILKKIVVDTFPNSSRRPPRYGRGRFLTTLMSKGISDNETLQNCIPMLLEKKYIKTIDKNRMLQPTALGIKVDEFHKKNCMWISNLDNAKAISEYKESIRVGDKRGDDLITTLEKEVAELKVLLGYNSDGPSPSQIELAQKIALSKGQILDSIFLSSKEKVSNYIAKNKDALENLCDCSYCGVGKIYNAEGSYRCSEKKCGFVLWKNKIKNFSEGFNYYLNQDDEKKLVVQIIQEGEVVLENLEGKKGVFNALITFKYDSKYKSYGIDILKYISPDSLQSIVTKAKIFHKNHVIQTPNEKIKIAKPKKSKDEKIEPLEKKYPNVEIVYENIKVSDDKEPNENNQFAYEEAIEQDEKFINFSEEEEEEVKGNLLW